MNQNELPADLHSCARLCDREVLVVNQAGGERVIVICCSCQNATPRLPLEEAKQVWNDRYGVKVA